MVARASAAVTGCRVVLMCWIYISRADTLVLGSNLYWITIAEPVHKNPHKLCVIGTYCIYGVYMEYGGLNVCTCSFIVLWTVLRYKWGFVCCTHHCWRVLWESLSMIILFLFFLLNFYYNRNLLLQTTASRDLLHISHFFFNVILVWEFFWLVTFLV